MPAIVLKAMGARGTNFRGLFQMWLTAAVM